MSENFETSFVSSRRRMLAAGAAAGAASLLNLAKTADASAPAAPVYEPRCVTDPAFGSGAGPAQGAVPNSPSHAAHNTAVFRQACASYLSDYRKLANPVEIYVPAGTWYLQDGFTVPLGCQLRGAGMGATVLSFSGSSPTLPIVTAGATLTSNSALVLPGASQGQYSGVGPFPAPAPVVEDMFLVVGNNNVPSVQVVAAGFLLQRLWLIGSPGLEVNGGDGDISNIICDNGVAAVNFSGAQNIRVSNLQIFSNNYGIQFLGHNNNIRFTNTQIVYSAYCPILFADNSTNNNIVFNGLSIVANQPYASTYAASVLIRAAKLQLTVTDGLFSNQPTMAIVTGMLGDQNQIVLNNCTFDGTRSNGPGYSSDNHGGGIAAGNTHRLEMSNCRFRNLGLPALTMNCSYGPSSDLIWNGGAIENYRGSGSPCQMTSQDRPMTVSMSNVISYDPVPLFSQTASGAGGNVRGRFVNCSSQDPNRDVVWSSANTPTAVATRIAAS